MHGSDRVAVWDKWHNILAITVQLGSTSIPIWVEVLDKSRGTSNCEERKAALKMVFKLLGRKRIRAFRENLKLNQSIKRICNYLFDLIAKRWQLYQHQFLVFVG
ncbi:MAG: hypothetical protein AAGI23_04085 [Bacteroidota bacterium]